MYKLSLFIIVLGLITSCKVMNVYIPGQEGLETVHKEKSITGEIDYISQGNNSGVHVSANYSPKNHLAALVDFKTDGKNYFSPTVAIGTYFADYKILDDSKNLVEIGRHLDIYAGASLINSSSQGIEFGSSFDPFGFPTTRYFDIQKFQGKRYFIQTGGHIKGKLVSFDIVLRKVWFNMDKIVTYGLSELEISEFKEVFSNQNLNFTEMSFKVNFGNTYKPFYAGFSTRYGNVPRVLNSAFSDNMVFIGANMNIYNMFKNKK